MLEAYEARKLTRKHGDDIRFVSFRHELAKYEVPSPFLGGEWASPIYFVSVRYRRASRDIPPSEALLRRLQEASSLDIRSYSRVDVPMLNDALGVWDATTMENGRLFAVEICNWESPLRPCVLMHEYCGPLAAAAWKYELALEEGGWRVVEATLFCQS